MSSPKLAVISYGVLEDSSCVYAILAEFISSSFPIYHLAKYTPPRQVTDPATKWDNLLNITEYFAIQGSLNQFTTMKITKNYAYFKTGTSTAMLFRFDLNNPKESILLTMPEDLTQQPHQTQSLAIDNQGFLYLGRKRDIIFSNNHGKNWSTIVNNLGGYRPDILVIADDILAIATNEHVYDNQQTLKKITIFLVNLKNNNVLPYDITITAPLYDNMISIIYGLNFNKIDSLLVVTFTDGTIIVLKYAIDKSGNISVTEVFRTPEFQGFRLENILQQQLADSSVFANLFLGVVKQNYENALATEASYSAVEVDSRGNVSPVTHAVSNISLTAPDQDYIATTAKFSYATATILYYLGFSGDLFISKDSGNSWQEVPLNT